MFWDSSALVPVLIGERRSEAMAQLFSGDAEPVIGWATPVECQSAVRRRHRESAWSAAELAAATDRLRLLVQHVDTVAPTDELRRRAGRLLASHRFMPPTRCSLPRRCSGVKNSRTARAS